MRNKNIAFFLGFLFLGGSLIFCSPGWSDIDIDTSSPFLPANSSAKISMDFQDAPLVDVLKIFSQQSNLNLVTSEAVSSKRVTVYLDKVPVNEALSQILRANSLTYELQPDTDIYIVKPLTPTDLEMVTRVYQLKNATVNGAKLKSTLTIAGGAAAPSDSSGIVAALKALLSPKGKIVEDVRTNSLMITDVASNFTKIEQALMRLDTPVTQILIEVEMLEVAKGTTDKIGVKMGDTPLTFTGGQKDGIFPFDDSVPFFGGPNGGTFEQPRYRVSTFSASGMTATLQFLKTMTDTRTLARPRILTLNNESAQINISTNEAIGLENTTTSSQNNSQSTATFERAQTGVFLTVTPQANVETGEITMAVVPKVIVSRAGGTFGSFNAKDAEERGAQSILRVQSGDTVIIGGLLRTDTTDIKTKVPLLGDLPLIGSLFRHKDKTENQRELIIFLTPHIMDDAAKPRVADKHENTITREQDMPLNHLQKVEKDLSATENEKF